MLHWLQTQASRGVLFVGFCELNGWQDLESLTELGKNRPKIVFRAANAGFSYSHVMVQTQVTYCAVHKYASTEIWNLRTAFLGALLFRRSACLLYRHYAILETPFPVFNITFYITFHFFMFTCWCICVAAVQFGHRERAPVHRTR